MRHDKQLARDAGLPKAFRQYATRYGKGVEELLQDHKKHPVPLLDHGRDRWEERNLVVMGVMGAATADQLAVMASG